MEIKNNSNNIYYSWICEWCSWGWVPKSDWNQQIPPHCHSIPYTDVTWTWAFNMKHFCWGEYMRPLKWQGSKDTFILFEGYTVVPERSLDMWMIDMQFFRYGFGLLLFLVWLGWIWFNMVNWNIWAQTLLVSICTSTDLYATVIQFQTLQNDNHEITNYVQIITNVKYINRMCTHFTAKDNNLVVGTSMILNRVFVLVSDLHTHH